VPLIGLVIAAQVGDALAPTLVDTHPLWLITLNARNRNLILVVNQVDLWPFFLIGTLRLMASDPLFYLLGYFYGDAAVHWVERRSTRFGEWIRQFEGIFRRASYPLVFLAPNNLICVLSGSSGMRPSVFFVLNFTGTLTRLALIVWLGEAFEKPIDWVLDLIGEYRWYLLAATITIVAVMSWNEMRQGTSEVGRLRRLGRDGGADTPGGTEPPDREDRSDTHDEQTTTDD
jgi:membrane protein DedA with SNARE-associated domain